MQISSHNHIPFVEYDSAGEQKWGYLDENTGKITIDAKYTFVYPFVGGFAQVMLDWHNKTLIDQFGKTVNVGKFDEVYLFTSENGKNTMAVLRNSYTRIKFQIGISFLGASTETGFYTEEYYKYRLVNLVTRQTIIPKKENYLYSGIEVAGDYFIVEPDFGKTDLYKFLDNGEVEKAVENDPARAAAILTEYLEGRGINAKVTANYDVKIDYRPYIKKIFTDTDFSAVLHDLAPELTFEKAEPFYRDHKQYLNTSLEITGKKYMLYFSIKGTSQSIVGIYNCSKADWEISPRFTITYTDTGEEAFYYVIEVKQTNNPNLYQLLLTNEEIGWDRHALISGGIYSLIENDYMIHDFMRDLHLFENYPPRSGVILMPDGGNGQRIINYPDKGVYYRDYGRIRG